MRAFWKHLNESQKWSASASWYSEGCLSRRFRRSLASWRTIVPAGDSFSASIIVYFGDRLSLWVSDRQGSQGYSRA